MRPGRLVMGALSVEWGERGKLLCPLCGNDNLHHGEVRVYARNAQDEGGTIVSVDERGKAVAVDVGPERLPGRRETLRIAFLCEECHGDDAVSYGEYEEWVAAKAAGEPPPDPEASTSTAATGPAAATKRAPRVPDLWLEIQQRHGVTHVSWASDVEDVS